VTFLKKLGTIILKVIGIATGFAPLVNQYVPGTEKVVAKADDKLNQALAVIVTAEQMFAAAGATKSGPDKLKAASAFVAQLVQQADMLAGRHPKDEAKFSASVQNLTSALADILNSYE
jgi:hypothetical protein